MNTNYSDENIVVIHVSPKGRDSWSGGLATPNSQGTDGPLASIQAAIDRVPSVRMNENTADRAVRIVLHDGIYFLESPLLMGPKESGTVREGTLTRGFDDPPRPVTITAAPNEKAVVSGGRRIICREEKQANGQRLWIASLPSVEEGTWYFRQLWVNGKRRSRPRLPEQGFYQFAGLTHGITSDDMLYNSGKDSFAYHTGDISPEWRNLEDVEVHFPNYWVDQHMKLERIDPERGHAFLDRSTLTRLIDDSWTKGIEPVDRMGYYYVDNVFEALNQPGEWYLDRKKGELRYLPMPDEELEDTEVIAPFLEQVLKVEGRSLDKDPAQEIRFENLTFSHTEWLLPEGRSIPGVQAACDVSGAVSLRKARTITFEKCSFANLGNYGVECAENTLDIHVKRCEFRDTGAGGVKIWHGCDRSKITNCHIHDGGRLFESAVGILVGRASGNQILGNEIHDLGYSGISVGWDWTDDDAKTYGNVIEHNHVHDVGRGELSDFAAIYLLGVAPGTRVRNNLVHDVRARNHRAWGIYLDASGSYVLIENNIAYRTNDGVLMMNQNRGHEIRNNIFALGAEEVLRRNVMVAFSTCVFERNIVYAKSTPVWSGDWRKNNASVNRNLYFVEDDAQPDFAGMTFQQWRERGLDVDSLIADPKFVDMENGDFRLADDSPAFRLGFQPIALCCDKDFD